MSQLKQLSAYAVYAGAFAVREITMRDVETFAVATADFVHEFEKDGALSGFYFSDGMTLPPDVFERYSSAMMAATGLCVDDHTPELSDDVLLPMCEAMLLMNRAFFKRERTNGNDGGDWYDSFQLLVGAGHKHADILDYPYSVFTGYCRAVLKQQAMADKRMAAAVRAGRFMSDAKFKEFIHAV